VLPAGSYCSTPGSPTPDGYCQAGYYCTLGVNTAAPIAGTVGLTGTGDICSAGYYCPTNSSIETACPAGYYTNTTGTCPIR